MHDVIPERYGRVVFPSLRTRCLWRAKVAAARAQATALLTVSEWSRRGLAEHFRMSPAELLKHFGVAGRPKKAVKPKYRNPEDPDQTWSGRGRKPEWVNAWLESGKELSELAI